MFALLSHFLSWLFRKTEVHVLIVGLDGAGKTSILEQLKHHYGVVKTTPLPEDKLTPTVGLNIGRLTFRSAEITAWDLGGRESLRVIWENYYSETSGIMFVLDGSDATRYAEAARALDTLLDHPDVDSSRVPVLFLSNKEDLMGKYELEEERRARIAALETQFRHKSKAALSRTKLVSVKESPNKICEGFEWLVSVALDQQR